MLQVGHGNEIRCDGPFQEFHRAVGGLVQVQVGTPRLVIALRHVGAVMVKAHRDSVRVSDERAAISAQSRMNDTSTARISSCGVVAPISAISVCIRSKLCTAIDNLVAVLVGHIVVDEPAQLVFHLRLGRAVGLAQRAVDELVRLLELVVRKGLRRSDVRDRRRRMFAGQVAVDERTDHVVVRYASQVTCRIQSGNRGAGVLVDPDS